MPTDVCGEARQWLIDLAERNIERLEARLEVYRQCADVRKERKDAIDRFDETPLGGGLRQYFNTCDRGLSRSLTDFRNIRKNNWEDEGEIWTGDVGGGSEAGLEVAGEVVGANENLVSGSEVVVGGAEGWVGSEPVAVVECENVTNEPEREEERVDAAGLFAVENENSTNEPEQERDLVGAAGPFAVENENSANEPEQEMDLVDAAGPFAVENENSANEPEQEVDLVDAAGLFADENENSTNEPNLGDEGFVSQLHDERVVAAASGVASALHNSENEPSGEVSRATNERPGSGGGEDSISDCSPMRQQARAPTWTSSQREKKKNKRDRRQERKALARRELERRLRAQLAGSGSEAEADKRIDGLRRTSMQAFLGMTAREPRAP